MSTANIGTPCDGVLCVTAIYRHVVIRVVSCLSLSPCCCSTLLDIVLTDITSCVDITKCVDATSAAPIYGQSSVFYDYKCCLCTNVYSWLFCGVFFWSHIHHARFTRLLCFKVKLCGASSRKFEPESPTQMTSVHVLVHTQLHWQYCLLQRLQSNGTRLGSMLQQPFRLISSRFSMYALVVSCCCILLCSIALRAAQMATEGASVRKHQHDIRLGGPSRAK